MHAILILIISFIALLWAANQLVTGASSLALRYQLPPFVIGLTLIAIGTSAPELLLAFLTNIKDKSDLTVSNAIGSNIANIGLVLGITILIRPTTLVYTTLKKTYPILIILMLFAYTLILDGFLSRIDGCLFLISCIILISVLIYSASQDQKKDIFYNKFKSAVISSRTLTMNITSVILGLIILIISARYIVNTAAVIARGCGMSELAIGLTIFAIGTTLPELATAVCAALKGHEDIAIGTVLGSNIYNLLLLLFFPSIINPTKLNSIILWRDVPVMISLTILLFFLNCNYKKKLSRWHGGILLLIYCSYIISLVIKAI